MAHATLHDLARLSKAARPVFHQVMARGCDDINGFAVTMKRRKGKKTKEAAIVFYVNRKIPLRYLPPERCIPRTISIPSAHVKDGVLEVATDVQAVRFQAFAFTAKERPAPGGVSISHFELAGCGTLGGLVKDKLNPDVPVILSNNHVLANTNEAAVGDPIIQPGDCADVIVRKESTMAHATLHDLARLSKAARPVFHQVMARGCDDINGFAVTMKRRKGKKTKEAAIVFYVNRKIPLRYLPPERCIPRTISIPSAHVKDGVLEVATDVQAVRFQAFAFTAKERPAPGGVSISHFELAGCGTLGGLVKDKLNPDVPVILSNNHVLANTNEAAVGDPIIQPGDCADGGTFPDAHIANLTRFYPINFVSGVNNLIDAAVAKPLDPWEDFVVHNIKDVVGEGVPTETRNIGVDDLGQFVKKSGRTTELTTGFVDAVNATVKVKYGFQVATFVDQLICEAPFAEPPIADNGDSGSFVLDNDNKLIGLLFAGSDPTDPDGDPEPATLIANPIKHVFNLLELETWTP